MTFDDAMNRFNNQEQERGNSSEQQQQIHQINQNNENSCSVGQQSEEWKNQVLVLINIRLGLDKIHQSYFKIIKKYMKLPQFVGIIGGKPKKAFYFVGMKEAEDKLIFLDPHIVYTYRPDIRATYDKYRTKYHYI